MAIDLERRALVLKTKQPFLRGSHSPPTENIDGVVPAGCALELRSWVRRELWSDGDTLPPDARKILVFANDDATDAQRPRILRRVLDLEVPILPVRKRGWFLVDHVVRVTMPTFLDALGHPDLAAAFRRLPTVESHVSASRACDDALSMKTTIDRTQQRCIRQLGLVEGDDPMPGWVYAVVPFAADLFDGLALSPYTQAAEVAGHEEQLSALTTLCEHIGYSLRDIVICQMLRDQLRDMLEVKSAYDAVCAWTKKHPRAKVRKEEEIFRDALAEETRREWFRRLERRVEPLMTSHLEENVRLAERLCQLGS